MDRKHDVLAQVFGYAAFRGGQEVVIDAQLAGRDLQRLHKMVGYCKTTACLRGYNLPHK